MTLEGSIKLSSNDKFEVLSEEDPIVEQKPFGTIPVVVQLVTVQGGVKRLFNFPELVTLENIFSKFVQVLQPVRLLGRKAQLKAPRFKVGYQSMKVVECIYESHLFFCLDQNEFGNLSEPFFIGPFKMYLVVIGMKRRLSQGLQTVMEIVLELFHVIDRIDVLYLLVKVDMIFETDRKYLLIPLTLHQDACPGLEELVDLAAWSPYFFNRQPV